MNIFQRKTDDFFSIPVKMVGIVLGIGGIFALLQGSLFGLVFLLLSAFALFAHNGFILNLETNEYKSYWGLLGFKFGQWQPLPTIKRITITKDTTIYRNQSHATGLSTYSKNTKSALNLRINEREFIAAAKGKYNCIMEDALFLSEHLNLEILDATTDKKTIINKKPIENTSAS